RQPGWRECQRRIAAGAGLAVVFNSIAQQLLQMLMSHDLGRRQLTEHAPAGIARLEYVHRLGGRNLSIAKKASLQDGAIDLGREAGNSTNTSHSVKISPLG